MKTSARISPKSENIRERMVVPLDSAACNSGVSWFSTMESDARKCGLMRRTATLAEDKALATARRQSIAGWILVSSQKSTCELLMSGFKWT